MFAFPDAQWAVMKQIILHQSRCNAMTDVNDGPTFWQQNWEPSFSCPMEQRLGVHGDGGKWVCDPHRLGALNHCIVYSIGSSDVWDFEVAVHAHLPKCEIHTFDHTTHGNGKPSFVNFHQWGLGVSGASSSIKTFSQIAQDLNHVGKTISLLKIDCEGCEYGTLLDAVTAFPGLINQVQVELHFNMGGAVAAGWHRLMWGFAKLGYFIYHKEPNIQFGGGICVEFAFIKLNITDLAFTETINQLAASPRPSPSCEM